MYGEEGLDVGSVKRYVRELENTLVGVSDEVQELIEAADEVQELIEAAEAHLRIDLPHVGDPRLEAALAGIRGQK